MLSDQFSAISLEVLITVPLRALLDQFALDFPGFCKVGQGHNQKIDLDAKGFIAVTKSVHLLKSLGLDFHTIFVDEAHHPLPSGMSKYKELYRFSATHTDEPDFRYTMGQAIDDGVLCDYDVTVPAVTQHHTYVCLADLLMKQTGRFRRVLAYCNNVAEARTFKMVVEELGLAAWHINAATSQKRRMAAIEEFSGNLTKPVHVMVTVEVLGEGINIPNADTCMFVEPRSSYRSVIQAIGRVLRHHPCKTLAHIVLPAVAVAANADAGVVQNVGSHQHAKGSQTLVEGMPKPAEGQPQEQPSTDFTAEEVIQRPNPLIQEPVLFAFPSHGRHQDVLESATDMKLEESVRAGIGSTTNSERIDRPAETNKPERLPVFDDGHKNANGALPAQRTHRTSAAVPKADQVLQRFSRLPSSAETSIKGEPIALPRHRRRTAHQGGTCWGSGMNGQEKSQWEMMATGVPESSSAASTKSLLDMPSAAEQRGDSPTRRVRTRSSLTASHTGELFSSQLERFLALLVQADARLVGSSIGHRIQLVDCRLAVEEEIGGWGEELYSQLTDILQQRDLWHKQLQRVEEFAAANGKLPWKTGKSSHEKALGNWLSNCCVRLSQGKLQGHRLKSLLNASSALIRRRVQGWLSQDPNCNFKHGCLQLKHFVEMHGKLPHRTTKAAHSLENKLAQWLMTRRADDTLNNPQRRAMLESVHPLVSELVAKWGSMPRQVNLPKWQDWLARLASFVAANRRLPSSKTERSLNSWLSWQLVRLDQFPKELVKQLRRSHPLIAAKVDARTREKR